MLFSICRSAVNDLSNAIWFTEFVYHLFRFSWNIRLTNIMMYSFTLFAKAYLGLPFFRFLCNVSLCLLVCRVKVHSYSGSIGRFEVQCTAIGLWNYPCLCFICQHAEIDIDAECFLWFIIYLLSQVLHDLFVNNM